MKDSFLWAALAAIGLGSHTLDAAPQLKYVVIVTRHGVRSPTWDADRLNQYSAQPWPDWGVPSGYLTPHGRALVKLLGSYYREWLLSEHLLAREGCSDKDRIYIFPDKDQRTIETGRALAESTLPGCGLGIHSQSGGPEDNIFSGAAPPDPVRAVRALRDRLNGEADKLIAEHRDAFEALQFILTDGRAAQRKLLESPVEVGASLRGNSVELDGPFAIASSLSEDLLLEYANGMQGADLGWGRLTPENLFRVLELHRVYADLMRRTPYLATARGARLMARVLASMEQAHSGKPVPGALGGPGTRLLILCGHDTNLSNISGMLGLSWTLSGYQPDETPPGGALIFSLFQDPRDGKWWVRVHFLAQTLDQMRDAQPLSLRAPPATQAVSIPRCETGSPAGACSWEQFASIATRASVAITGSGN